jgi:putative membrane protein
MAWIGYIKVMKPFFTRWLVTTLAVLVVSSIPGIGVRADSLGPLVAAGLLLGILNAFVRPVLLLLSLPLILLTMGLFFFIVNALTLYIVGSVIPGFHVSGFGAALVGSILISIVSWIFSAFFKGSDGRVHVLKQPDRKPQMKTVRGRVIE